MTWAWFFGWAVMGSAMLLLLAVYLDYEKRR